MHKLACNVAPICSNCIHLSMSKSTTLLQFEAFEVCWSFVRRSFHWNGWHEVQGTSVCKEMEDGIPLPGLKVPFRTAFSQAINFALRSIRVTQAHQVRLGMWSILACKVFVRVLKHTWRLIRSCDAANKTTATLKSWFDKAESWNSYFLYQPGIAVTDHIAPLPYWVGPDRPLQLLVSGSFRMSLIHEKACPRKIHSNPDCLFVLAMHRQDICTTCTWCWGRQSAVWIAQPRCRNLSTGIFDARTLQMPRWFVCPGFHIGLTSLSWYHSDSFGTIGDRIKRQCILQMPQAPSKTSSYYSQGFGLWDALGVEVAEMAEVFGWIGRMCIS